MTEIDDDNIPLDPGFADRFERDPRRPACQLYLISPPAIDESFADALEAALGAGPVAAFQLRIKGLDDHLVATLAEPLIAICRKHDVAFIVNDSIGLAKRLGADGVHLGQEDGDPREARDALGKDAQIGVTCHDSRHLAMEAGEAGGGLCSLRSFLPDDDQGDQAPARAFDPRLVVDAVRHTVRGDRRDHGGQCRAAGGGGRRFRGGLRGGLGAPGGTGGRGEGVREGFRVACDGVSLLMIRARRAARSA